jgi:hypothetical protein
MSGNDGIFFGDFLEFLGLFPSVNVLILTVFVTRAKVGHFKSIAGPGSFA